MHLIVARQLREYKFYLLVFVSKAWPRFCRPQYLFKTSPRSIPFAGNSWIWHFYLNNTLLPQRNLWNVVFATLRPESIKLTCQFRRFLPRTFRPVVCVCVFLCVFFTCVCTCMCVHVCVRVHHEHSARNVVICNNAVMCNIGEREWQLQDGKDA